MAHIQDEQEILEKIKFWKKQKDEGAIDDLIFAAAVARVNAIPVAPLTNDVPKENVLRAEDATVTKANQIDDIVREWFGSAETKLFIGGEALRVFNLLGSCKAQRDLVEQHQKESNLNARITDMFKKSEGKPLTFLECAATASSDEKDKNFIAKTAVLYYIADLASIIVSWWMCSTEDGAGSRSRQKYAQLTMESLIKEQNDQAKIFRLKSLYEKTSSATTPDAPPKVKVPEEEKTTCTTCNKKHLGVCRFAIVSPSKVTMKPKKGGTENPKLKKVGIVAKKKK